MEFRETLLAAQRNQQQSSSAGSSFYKARFDPPKKENRPKDKLSANIQKFLAKKEEEEKQKKLEEKRKRDELLAMRDPKAIRKIQKSLKVFRSANKSVIADAIDTEHTAITRDGPLQPDHDDYGYESQEAAAIYEKMMEKYSKIPDEPKFTLSNNKTKKDLEGTKERVKQALLQGEEPVPHKRRRKTAQDGETDRTISPPPKPEQEKKKDEKPKIRKPAPPPMDFNQILKLAEQKQFEQPAEVVPKKVQQETEPERLMTKKQRKEYEEEMARRKRRQERLEAEKSGKKVPKEEKSVDRQKETRPEEKREKRVEPSGSGGIAFGRIPKIGAAPARNDSPKSSIKDKLALEKEKIEKLQREKAKLDKERQERNRDREDLERLEKLRAERERIEKDIERLNKDRERLEKSKQKLESQSKMGDRPRAKQEARTIDLKSQNTYRIDKTGDRKSIPSKSGQHMNGQKIPADTNGMRDKFGKKPEDSPKLNGVNRMDSKAPVKGKPVLPNSKPQPTKPAMSNSFDFDKHINSLKNGAKAPESAKRNPGDVRKKMHPDDIRKKQLLKRRALDSEEEYDSEMDDFIDDGDGEEDYSKHIKEIFGYDKSKYRDLDDDDDPTMESSFSRVMQEEYVSKKIGIMEDLEDIRMERMEKQMKKKKRRISDD